MEETLLLSYHNSALYTSDPLTLREGGWLSDAILGFYFEYLAHDVLAGNQTVLFLKPALVQCLRVHANAALHSAAVPPDTFKRELVFIPINGSAGNPDDAHWSLLVYVRRHKPTFHYFDSMANANYPHALAVKDALTGLLRRTHRVPDTEEDPPLITHSCPQQENGSDCGIFVVLFADILTRRYADAAWNAKAEAAAAAAAVAMSGTVPTAQLLPSIPSPAPSIGSLTGSSANNSDALLYPTTTYGTASAKKRRITLEKTFWWIDYGDLSNPIRARLILRSLVKKLCIKNNAPLI